MKLTTAAKTKIDELNARFVGKTVLKPCYDFTAKNKKMDLDARTITAITAEVEDMMFGDGRCLIINMVGKNDKQKDVTYRERRFLDFHGKDKWLTAAADLEKEFAKWEAEADENPVYRNYDNDEGGRVEEVVFNYPILTGNIKEIEDKVMIKAKEVADKKLNAAKREYEKALKRYTI